MPGFRINALQTRSALVPDFLPRHTISHRSPRYSAPLTPPLLPSQKTLPSLIYTPPPFPHEASLVSDFPPPSLLPRIHQSPTRTPSSADTPQQQTAFYAGNPEH